MAVYGYARCSTNESKQDIDRQKKELMERGVEREKIFLEYASGTKSDRVEFNRLLNTCQSGDTIITTEVSRLTRSTKHLCEIIDMVRERRLKLIIIDSITVDCTNGELDPMTEAFVKMAGVFGELERNIISARVKSGLANAIAKGARVGRPHVTAASIPSKFLKYYPNYTAGKMNVTDFARLTQLSRTTIYKYCSLLEKSGNIRACEE